MNWASDPNLLLTRDFLGVSYETFDSPATGQPEIRWLGTPRLYPALPVVLSRPAVQLRRPKAYWVPGSKPEVIARLKWHGLRMETLPSNRTLALEMYRLVNPRTLSREGIPAFEGRVTLKTDVKTERRQVTFPIGSVRVPTDQPLGDLAMALLEPESDDSLFAWGFFLEILQRTEYIEGYVLAPAAERMLAEDAELKAEFNTRLAEDPSFASDPAARMRWFYERTPYYDDRFLLYPVGIER
jgi:hypothetical protein